jgi:hypothetical protein
MTARTTVTLQCDRTRDERCHGIYRAPGSPSIDAARHLAWGRGWNTVATEGGRRQDVCPACWPQEGRKGAEG